MLRAGAAIRRESSGLTSSRAEPYFWRQQAQARRRSVDIDRLMAPKRCRQLRSMPPLILKTKNKSGKTNAAQSLTEALRRRTLDMKTAEGRSMSYDLEMVGPAATVCSRVLRKSVLDEDDGTSSGSSASGAMPGSAGDKVLQRRARRRTTRHLEEALAQTRVGSSFLEKVSVSAGTLAGCHASLAMFLTFAHSHAVDLKSDSSMDAGLVAFMTEEYFKGHHPCRGERLLASLMMLDPSFSMKGSRKIPPGLAGAEGLEKADAVEISGASPLAVLDSCGHKDDRQGAVRDGGLHSAMCVGLLPTVGAALDPSMRSGGPGEGCAPILFDPVVS